MDILSTIPWLSWLWLFYPLLGVIAGFSAGLLGIGGGIISVPILLLLHQQQQFPDASLLKVVLGTSMASIVFTAFSSMINHHRLGNVQWSLVFTIFPGLLVGVVLAGILITHIFDQLLAVIFMIFSCCTALQMLFDWKAKPSRVLPTKPVTLFFGGIIGLLSTMISASGGFLLIPYLSWHNVQMKKAVAVSSACGFFLALFASIVYMTNGHEYTGLPSYTIGFVYWPGVLGIALTSIWAAAAGAKLSSRLPTKVLKKCFALLLLIVVLLMFQRYFLKSF